MAGSDCRLTTGVICTWVSELGTTTGIVKWNSDPGRHRLSADNGPLCINISIGPKCYRYREMEFCPWQTSIVG
ncbi:hypothetical protein VAWG007_31290 [Aeromonas enteropelogenes]|nr:hypothetical protein VAWG007_31290 [Aeromonas enteropelogenes]